MADSYPDRKNASGLWSINEISKNKIAEGNWPGNFGNRGMFAGGIAPSSVDTVDFITITTAGDASDFGNLQTADRYGCTGSGSTTRGLFVEVELIIMLKTLLIILLFLQQVMEQTLEI